MFKLDSKIVQMVTTIDTGAPVTARCAIGANGASFAVIATVNTPEYSWFCVDSQGARKVVERGEQGGAGKVAGSWFSVPLCYGGTCSEPVRCP